MTERVKGHIKWFNHQKRYGFIRRGDGLPDIFVHLNEFRSAADAQWVRDEGGVEFGVEQTSKGPSAVDVVVLNTAAALVVGEAAMDMQEAITKATAAIDSGAAAKKLAHLIEVSNG